MLLALAPIFVLGSIIVLFFVVPRLMFLVVIVIPALGFGALWGLVKLVGMMQ